MSNRGGKSHQHGLVGMKTPVSAMAKRRNKAKANARKAESLKAFQALTAGI